MAISNFRHDKIPSFHSDGVIVAICWIIAWAIITVDCPPYLIISLVLWLAIRVLP
jgi:hypothetical protein